MHGVCFEEYVLSVHKKILPRLLLSFSGLKEIIFFCQSLNISIVFVDEHHSSCDNYFSIITLLCNC